MREGGGSIENLLLNWLMGLMSRRQFIQKHLSDKDIHHRNFVILKEATAIWEASQMLRISFNRDKNILIDVFKQLEEDERSRK